MTIGTATAALIAGGGAIAGGIMEGRAAEDAAEAQTEASDAAIAEQRRQFDIIRELNEPFRKTDIQAMEAQKDLLGLGGGGGGQVSTGGGTDLPNRGVPQRLGNRLTGVGPRERAPGQTEVPGGGGIRQGIPGINAPEADTGFGNRFRAQRDRHSEGLVNSMENPDNRRIIMERLLEENPNNPFLRNALRRNHGIGG